MSSPFIAEIRIFACNYAPKGWATCDGQILPISQNTALFSLINTFYGGNGTTNFALPTLKASAPLGSGRGPGLSEYDVGQSGGEETVTLSDSQAPFHAHAQMASNQPGEDASPVNATLARSVGASLYQTLTTQNIVQLSPSALSVYGSSQPHNNMQPYLPLLFCIALQGIFPQRS